MTGIPRVKGENFYRDAKKARRVQLLSGKTSRPVRDRRGKIIKEAPYQSSEAKPGRIAPDRRWFGSSHTISQEALDHFTTSMQESVHDPYAVILKRNKLPMALITDAAARKGKSSQLTQVEPFEDTFGAKAQRKRPRVDASSIEEFAALAEDQNSKDTDDQGKSISVQAQEQAEIDEQTQIPQDYILSAGTSKRIWAELYKVIDSSDVILHILDARDPLGTRCDSVEKYISAEKTHKKLIFVLNKVDLVPSWVAAAWVKHLSKAHPTVAFHASINNSFGKGALIQLLRQFATLFSDRKQISVGLIGYPNVGKSSVINTLKAKAVCRAAPVPGETRVWQYIALMKRINMIDCPGIVPPSAHDTDAQKVLKGIVRVEHLSAPADHVDLLLDSVKKEYLERTYQVKGWRSTEEFLVMIANKTGKLLKGGDADLRTVSIMVLNDWIRGRIPYFKMPPRDDDDK